MTGPVPVRPAATLLLVRDAPEDEADGVPGGPRPGDLQVLMVRRSSRADFVGGAHVFPGGGVDQSDEVADVDGTVAGRTDAEASALLGLASGGLAYWVAALRECFEEAGILLAYRDLAAAGRVPAGRGVLSLDDPADEERFRRLRAEVNAGTRPFLDVCRQEGLVLAVDLVHYFAHWITPEPSPRRYDTRFFVAAAPEGQVPLCDDREVVAEIWVRPADALRRHREGEIDLVLPTIRTLQAIGRFADAASLVSWVSGAGEPVPSGRRDRRSGSAGPRMVADGHGRRLALPGDPEGGDGRLIG